jgi:peptide/nickel transport system substrate-binding protein
LPPRAHAAGLLKAGPESGGSAAQLPPMIRRRVTAIAATAALAAAALALLPAASAAADSVVRIGLPQQPNTLNPLVGGEFYENYLDEAIFSGLVVIDSRGNVAPDLIQNVPTKRNGGISGDGLTITYILQPGLKWQDGAPLTAADVAFTFKLMRDPKVPFPLASQYTNVASLEARDKQTVVVHLKKPDADAVAELFVNGQNGSIVPEHVLRNAADIRKAPFSAKPVGSGPYSVESWSRDTGLVLRANPRYFRGRPAIGELRVRVIPDTNTMAIALRAGDLDFAPGITPAAVSMLRGTPAIRLDEAPTEGLVWLIDRVDAPPFDDARVRRAFGLDAGRDAIARKAYLGYAQPAVELVPPWSPWATVRHAPPADPKGAAKLLDDAGWRVGPDGVRTRGSRKLSVTLTTIAGGRALLTTATLLQAQWHELGADVAIKTAEANQLYAPDGILAKGEFQFALTAIGFATTPDRSTVLSSHSFPPAGSNSAHYANAAVDKAIEQAQTSLDPATRRHAFAAIEKAVAADAPYAPLVWEHTIVAVSKKISGFKQEPVNSDLWNVYEWKLQ